MNTNSEMWSSRTKTPALFYATGRKRDLPLDLEKKRDAADPSFGVSSQMNRKYYFEARSNYQRTFDDVHRVGGLIHYYMEDFIDSRNNNDLDAIPKRYIGLRSCYLFV